MGKSCRPLTWKKPFTFDKHANLPPDQRPAYRLADTEMTFRSRLESKDEYGNQNELHTVIYSVQ